MTQGELIIVDHEYLDQLEERLDQNSLKAFKKVL